MSGTPQTTKSLCPLGQVLRGIRAATGVTQATHAEALGIGPTYLSRLESGSKKASYERVVEIIAALRLCPQVETQARLAILHGDGNLEQDELAVLVAYHGCRTVICLYKTHSSYGEPLDACPTCVQQMLCRPEGHRCPNGCGVEEP